MLARRQSEERYFKHTFKVYVARKFSDQRLELWAISTIKIGEQWFLGLVKNGILTKPDNFYMLPWDVQKQSERLYRLLKI